MTAVAEREIKNYKKDRGTKGVKLREIYLTEPVLPQTFTYEEKEALVTSMTQLDEDAIRGLLLIIHRTNLHFFARSHISADGQPSGEIEIDFLQLDDATLFRLKGIATAMIILPD